MGFKFRKSYKWSIFQRFMWSNIRSPSTLKHTIKLGFVLNFTTDTFLYNFEIILANPLKFYLILLRQSTTNLRLTTVLVKICIFTTKSRVEHHVAVLPSFRNRQKLWFTENNDFVDISISFKHIYCKNCKRQKNVRLKSCLLHV